MGGKTTLAVLVLGVVGNVVPFGPKSGPYEPIVEKIELCEDQGSGIFVFGTKITSAGGGKYLYKEKFRIGVPMDQNMKAHVEIQKWGNGGWTPKFSEHTVKGCEAAWVVIGDFVKKLMESAGTKVDKCPVPAGNYTAHDLLVGFYSMEKTVPVLEYGRYRGKVHVYYNDQLVGCLITYGEAKPKNLL